MFKRLLLLLLLGAFSFSNMAARQSKPNVLLLMAEDLSFKLGAFGDELAVTPNLDKLAATGVRFPNTFTAAGVCAPSRTAHILGMHQISVGGQHMRTRDFKASKYRAVPSAEIKAYPELLRKAGYYTFTNKKLDYQFSDINANSGPFTIWDYEGSKPDWNRRDKDQPFFGLINFKQSHESQLFPEVVEKIRRQGRGLALVDPQMVEVPPYYPDLPAVRKDIAQQYNNAATVDQLVGELLEKLEKDGLADNTIVIWTTDHGDGLPRAKREIYDSGIKVPMIIHWPEKFKPSQAEAGSVDNRLISFVDFAPSILSMFGIETPGYMQGSKQFGENNLAPRRYIYASKDRLDGFEFRERAVRDHRFKYIKNYLPGKPGATHIKYRDGLDIMQALWQHFEQGKMNEVQKAWFEPRPAHELYDLVNDPHETINLAPDKAYTATLLRMQGALAAWQQQVTDLSELPELEMANKFWPDAHQPKTYAPIVSVTKMGAIVLTAASENASLGFRIDKGKWQVYSGPIRLKAGQKLVAKSVRYGWQESEEVLYSL